MSIKNKFNPLLKVGIQKLTESIWDITSGTYGEIISPISGVKEIFMEENNQGLTLLQLKNTNDIDNYVGAVIALKGSGADFTNNMYFGKYGAGFYIPSWADNGVMATDKDMVIGAVGATSRILFQLTGGYTAPVDTMEINSDGLLKSLIPSYEALVLLDNDIPNKKYVDDIITSLPIITADNGLTMVGDNIEFGGVLTKNTTIDLTSDEYEMYFTSPPNNSRIVIDGWAIYGIDDSNSNSVSFTPGGVTFRNNTLNYSLNNIINKILVNSNDPDFEGLVYGADYSSDFGDRSLVDKGYVDSEILASVNTFDNGLTKTSSNVRLGGDIDNNTNIKVTNGNVFTLEGEFNGGLASAYLHMNAASMRSDFTTNDSSGTTTGFETNSSLSKLFFKDTISNESKIQVTQTAMLIDDDINLTGLTYADDYSINFSARSLVDKEYVDTKVMDSMTSTEIVAIASPTLGMLVFNTTEDAIATYNSNRWQLIEYVDMITAVFTEIWNGGDFATNGWIVVNDTTNYWMVGNADASIGVNSAYITNDGVNSQYTINNTETSHIYKDFVIPAGTTNIAITFDFLGEAEVGYDYLRVYTAPTTFTPAAGIEPGVGSEDISGNLVDESAWINKEFSIDPSYAGSTLRVIFTWHNDGSVGTNPGAQIDNIQLKLK